VFHPRAFIEEQKHGGHAMIFSHKGLEVGGRLAALKGSLYTEQRMKVSLSRCEK